MAVHPKNEDWDPEYTPKSRKYYLVGSISFPCLPSVLNEPHGVLSSSSLHFCNCCLDTPASFLRLSLSMMTETGRQSASGWTTEGEDGEASREEGPDSSSAKPPGAPTPMAPNGPMTSSRSTGSKVASRKRRQYRTIKMEKSMARILEQ